jgi:tetratricopeptide (TPR) repeat protein
MYLSRILPRPFRLARFYAKAKKVSANKNIADKYPIILKLEKNYGGKEYFLNNKINPTMACLIGKKDIGKIYTDISVPADALLYLNSALSDLQFIKKNNNNLDRPIIDNQVFILYYQAIAYSQQGNIKNIVDNFDKINLFLNDMIEQEPSNKRAMELYEYMLKRTYSVMVKCGKRFPSIADTYYSACKKLFQTFNQRDRGNDIINEYLSELTDW